MCVCHAEGLSPSFPRVCYLPILLWVFLPRYLFDFAVVVLSMVDVALSDVPGVKQARILRVFRTLRVFRAFGRFERLKVCVRVCVCVCVCV